MKQLAVVSGKGGTGKTSIIASLAAMAVGRAVIADCDVDAPDLHLILRPQIKETHEFYGIKLAVIDQSKCTGCGLCQEHCRFGAISDLEIDPMLCEGCGVCNLVCPAGAIDMVDRHSGYAFVSDTRFGPMVHAELFPAEEASGKLVSMVREMAKDLASDRGLELVLIDGSPGIGCPVIASITGVDMALIVTEPTITGRHDLERILAVVEHFGAEPLVCINKHDLNPDAGKDLEAFCQKMGVDVIGRIPFDTTVIDAMVLGRAVVELEGPASDAIKALWESLQPHL